MMKRLYFFLAVSSICWVTADSYAQTNADTPKIVPKFKKPTYKVDRDINGKATIDLDKWVDETSADIMRVRPGSFTSNPDADRAVVRSVFAASKEKMSQLGYTDESVLNALQAAWIELSIKEYDKQKQEANYTDQDILNMTLNMSELNIVTTPDGATIKIDNYEGLGESNTNIWVREGRHILEVRKNGYIPIKEAIDIKPLKSYPLTKTLQRIK